MEPWRAVVVAQNGEPWTLKIEAWNSVRQWSKVRISFIRSRIRILIEVNSRIWIRINVKSWIRIRIRIKVVDEGVDKTNTRKYNMS